MAMVKHLTTGMFYLICVLFLIQLQSKPVSSHLNPHGIAKPKKGMYLPITFTTPYPPGYICHHFRKVCYVPGVSSGWRGWYRKGFSGFFIYQSWMYYISKVTCPCIFPMPPTPQSESTGSLVQRESGM